MIWPKRGSFFIEFEGFRSFLSAKVDISKSCKDLSAIFVSIGSSTNQFHCSLECDLRIGHSIFFDGDHGESVIGIISRRHCANMTLKVPLGRFKIAKIKTSPSKKMIDLFTPREILLARQTFFKQRPSLGVLLLLQEGHPKKEFCTRTIWLLL